MSIFETYRWVTQRCFLQSSCNYCILICGMDIAIVKSSELVNRYSSHLVS